MNIKKQLIVAQQHLKARRFDKAEAICSEVLEVMPDNIAAAMFLGSSHLKRSNYSESRRMFETVLNRDPDNPDANNDLGVIFLHQKDFASAEKYFRKVISIDPCHVNATLNLGNICFGFEKWESAESLYKKVLAIEPEYGAVLNNLGQLLLKQNRIVEGVDLMEKILNLSTPGPAMFFAYLIAKQLGLWDVAERVRPAMVDVLMNWSSGDHYLAMIGLSMLSDPNVDNESLFQITSNTAAIFDKACLSESFRNYEKAMETLQAGRRMRIGYLSGDFFEHVCSHFVRGLINHYDRDRFEVFCYSNTAVVDQVTREYQSNVDAFIDIRDLSDLQLAERIHEDGIHLLVDLSGYTNGTRISVMSYRAAPVQISYMGYPFSTGFRSIDYAISDPYSDGPSNAKYWTETLLHLPEIGAAFGTLHGEEINPVPPCERNGYVTFGSLLNTYKLNPIIIRMWSQILKRESGARMILNHPNLEPQITRRNILKEFAKHGVLGERVQFIWEKLTDASHLYYYNDIDIALDSLPMTGGQTTIDALWMGVPVVTWVGETTQQRGSYAILNALGIDVADIVAFSQEEYIEKAVALANSPVRIAELHQIIPQALSQSVLCDPERLAGQLESAYIEAWNRKFPENPHDPGPRRDSLELVSIRSGTQIVVSGSIDNRFNYILNEQQGWFDPEYDFVLDMIQPDMRVIDIVAEVGVYAVPLAQKMTAGKVWAISTDVAYTRYLLKSKDHNHLDRLQVLENARLGNLNLDREMMCHDWSSIDFVRINSEGSDQGLIRRGAEFFSQLSPLLMFGIKNRAKRDLSLVKPLEERGYAPYRLIPGINVLAPFDLDNELEELDDFSINLFCCKKDRAEQLENRGLLMQKNPPTAILPDGDASVLQRYLAGLPYASGMMAHWLNISSRQKGWELHLQALDLFAAAKTENQTASLRYACIQGALCLLRILLADKANVSRVMSMIRVLTDMGKRVLAVNVLGHLAEFLETGKGGIVMNIDEPFLALSDRFASVNPGDRISEWIYASILEQREKLRAFSSYYTGKESLEILDKIKDIGFQSDEMERRRQLIRMRYRMDGPSRL